MTIEWRKTAGGVEIAEHDSLTCVVYCGRVEVYRNGLEIDGCGFSDELYSKRWFEEKYCQPKYTVTKYGDGGEVYASNDGKLVAMVNRWHGDRNGWECSTGNGKCLTGIDEITATEKAIAYVTKGMTP